MVGGGITGLAAAWELRNRGQVTVFEPGHVGGKLLTTQFLGRAVDCGPDAFLTRTPSALRLASELGLAGDLVAPSGGQALLWSHRQLRSLPERSVLGVPTTLGPLWRSGLLSPVGVARAGLDLVLPASRWPEDLTVDQLVGRRLGRQVAARLVDPLVGSIHAGTTEMLSAAATTPQVLAAARSSRSLMRGLRPATAAAGHAGGDPARGVPGQDGRPALFVAPRGGMQVLADRLASALVSQGVDFVRSGATAVVAGAGDSVWVEPGEESFDGVVLAVPAWVSARLLGPLAPAGLGSIPSASVVLATIAYDAGEVRGPAGVGGILVPRGEGRLMTACSFGDTKWPDWGDEGTTVLRVSAGRFADERAMDLDDEALVGRLDDEVRAALSSSPASGRAGAGGLAGAGSRAGAGGALSGTANGSAAASPGGAPLAWRVSRWPRSFPQYRVGHLGLVDRIDRDLAGRCPRIALAGASYRGSGIPACIASGRGAAAAVAERVERAATSR